MDNEETERQLNDLEEKLESENASPKKGKIIIAILIILIILLVAFAFLLYKYFDKKIKDEKNKFNDNNKEEQYLLGINGFLEKWYDIYGNRTKNISYLENGVVPNTFRQGKANYIPDIGDVNEGKDYESNNVNVYDLYIPYSSLSKKQSHNGIILFVHGGGFENNTKEETEGLATRFSKLGYITANIEYSNCLEKYKQKSVYRILDEITACIKSIKNELKSQGFDENKLEIALYGISAGAQLSLVYGFSDKNKILPLKFIMNSVGIVSMYPKYWYKPTIFNITLDSIENYEDVENAEKNNIFTQMDLSFNLRLMNSMSGKKYTQEQIDKLLINNVIQTDNEIYKELDKFVKYGYPLEVLGNNTTPILSLYGGNDDLVGVAHYCYLKQAYVENGAEENITLVYMKHAGHERFHHGIPEDIKAMKEMQCKMIEFAEKYFTRD